MKCKIVTHNGSFHTDEIFASALIKMFVNPDVEVVRTRCDRKLEKYTNDPNVWVVDVGRSYDEALRNFDHHQASFNKFWDNTVPPTPYSSCGLVWSYLKKKGLIQKHHSDEIIKIVEDRLIKKIDMHDNRVKKLPQAVMFMLANRDNNTIDDFHRVMKMAKWHLNDTFAFAEGVAKNAEKMKCITFEGGGEIAVFNEHVQHIIPAVSSNTNAKIIVMPKDNGASWSVRSIARPEEGYLTPYWWRGKFDKELRTITGIDDIIFVHKAGYLASAGSRKSALKIAHQMIE